MELARKLDEYGKPAWITVMVLSFILFWPAGLAILFYLIWSGRMRCWKNNYRNRWQNTRSGHGHGHHRSASTGNSAFDEYREETLRRLEDEQDEFESFLERLRQAKDKSEFDQFMQDRKANPRPADDQGATDSPGA